jgi:hypothetical protein
MDTLETYQDVGEILGMPDLHLSIQTNKRNNWSSETKTNEVSKSCSQ